MLKEIPSVNVIKAWVSIYRAEPGRDGAFPDARSGRIPGTDITWRAISDAFREGRVVGRRVSFAWWLKNEFPDEYKSEAKITNKILRDAVDTFRSQFDGAFPNAHSGTLPGADITWFSIDARMKEGSFSEDGVMQTQMNVAPRKSLAHWLWTQYPDYDAALRAVEGEPISVTVNKRRPSL